ncbi:urate hydroxylase PuuD [Noviherbaspirillum soli]|uniref:urate hydroxylase PuuD n=1 Tax=Noviherbaspirillum soli TaxID=1064518 RepID=UPI00188ACA43|nr:urate hydroxylase PuuD [Noviherbaspirillum soli]
MEGYLLDWANLLLRWLHVIVAIAWIGSSFYFVWLDNSLRAPIDAALKEKGVGGELWAVHGGGFYNPQKYLGAPPALPQDLHWFYWESYSTWLSGFGLFSVLYLFNPRVFLIDPNVANISPTVAVVAALAFLVLGWLVYDIACKALQKQEKLLAVLVVLYVVAAAWAACHLFSGRAAFLIIGAMIATIMSANVFFVIIPGQRKVIASMKAGEPVNPIHGQRGKQRSVHNTYFTLPVLFAMLSNHYSMTYSHKHNWLVLVLIMLAGVLIRQFFILRHKGKLNLAYPTVAVAVLAGVVAWLSPSALPSAPVQAGAGGAAATDVVELAQVQKIMQERCVQCHAAQPSMMPTPAKGIMLDTPESVRSHAQQIYQQVVVQKAMPLGNATKITDQERGTIAKWFETGAK